MKLDTIRGVSRAVMYIVACALLFGFVCVCAPEQAIAVTGAEKMSVASSSVEESTQVSASLTKSKIQDKTKVKKGMKNRKFVMVGDSYAKKLTGFRTFGWPELLAEKLKLRSSQYKIARKSGAGFAKSTKWFRRMILKQKKDATVTDVLIVGGVGNNIRYTRKQIKSGYDLTIKVVKKRYPNARIMHANFVWHADDPKFNLKVKNRIPFYRSLAKKNGVLYLRGCENTLVNHRNWMRSDMCHPNWRGAIAIANKLYTKIKK